MATSHNRAFSIITILLLTTSSCDQTREDAADFCPNTPQPGEAGYFPDSLGQTWVYDYIDSSAFLAFPVEVRTGLLRWSIIKREDTCQSTRLLLQEHFTGEFRSKYLDFQDTTYAVSWDTTRQVLLDGDQLTIEGYITQDGRYGAFPLQWIWPDSSPDIIEEDTTYGCGFGGCINVAYHLQRGKGLTYFFFNNYSRQGGPFRRTMTLKEGL